VSVERFLGMVVMALAIVVDYWIFVMDSKQVRIRCELNQSTRAQADKKSNCIFDTKARARLSGGISRDPIHRMVERAIEERRHQSGGVLVDVGCGSPTPEVRVPTVFTFTWE
jgi:hypothetical protein